jgi:hypothetical protein
MMISGVCLVFDIIGGRQRILSDTIKDPLTLLIKDEARKLIEQATQESTAKSEGSVA